MDGRLWPCAPCGAVTVFVQPPCGDGHIDGGGDCPEWACVDCGAAVLAGGVEDSPPQVLVRVA